MKKLISLALVIVLALSISVPAFAADATITYENAGFTVTPNDYGLTITPVDEKDETLVSFSVNPNFAITIPATVALVAGGANAGFDAATATVTVAAHNIFESGHEVEISIASKNGYELLTADMGTTNGNGVEYTVTPADGADDDKLTLETTNALVANKNVQLVAELGGQYHAEAQTFTLTFATTDKAEYSGLYTDILTFTVAYGEIN